MDYYVKEIQIGDGVKKTAGIKARDDLYSIMQSLNMNEIEIPSQENKRNSKSIIGKMKEHFSILSIWKNKFKRIKAVKEFRLASTKLATRKKCYSSTV